MKPITLDFHNPTQLATFIVAVMALVVPMTLFFYAAFHAILGQAYNVVELQKNAPVGLRHTGPQNYRQDYDSFYSHLFANLRSGVCNPDNSTVALLTRDKEVLSVHSHNDYWRPKPVFDAFSHGCTSIESDIWLEDGELLVGHNDLFLDKQYTVERLYLDVLRDLLDEVNCVTSKDGRKGGFFYDDPHSPTFLYVDIKTEAVDTYKKFMKKVIKSKLLEKGYLTTFDFSKEKLEWGPLTLVITGNAPVLFMQREPMDDPFNVNKRFAFADAQLDNIEAFDTENLSVVASGSLRQIIQTEKPVSFGGMNQTQTERLVSALDKAHSLGLKARVWDTPNWPKTVRNTVWEQLLKAGVDYLNVDDLDDVASF